MSPESSQTFPAMYASKYVSKQCQRIPSGCSPPVRPLPKPAAMEERWTHCGVVIPQMGPLRHEVPMVSAADQSPLSDFASEASRSSGDFRWVAFGDGWEDSPRTNCTLLV